ncbi:hypothetical protein LCGC14_0164460 [marine sediment metagenome]|uniref:Transglutaminase-like domain-containing protein n=1 Tax=marine sediment metagenome TaxID=412755 RepID=A0A0F9VAN5_9ZZZZ
MSAPRWLARHPEAADLVFDKGVRVRDWFLGLGQYVRYFFKRRRAVRELRLMRGQFRTGYQLAAWYKERGFKWKQDPWGGRLDYSSVPWVSVVLNYGDCDDMMRIAECVLKDRYSESWRVYVGSKSGDWHAAYILRRGGEFWLASNQNFYGPFGNRLAAAHMFYGGKTENVFYD